MQIFRHSLPFGVIALSAAALLSGCVDDNYDLTDVDTTTRVTVNDLTIPIELKEINLKDVIKLDDNENISIINVNGKEAYAIQKGGSINTSDFKINPIHVAAPTIGSSQTSINVPSVPGININTQVAIPSMDMKPYDFRMNNIDASLLSLEMVKTVSPIKVDMTLRIPYGIVDANNSVAFSNISVQLPWGLMANSSDYDSTSGILNIAYLPVGNNGIATYSFYAYGLDLGSKGTIANHSLSISGEVGLKGGLIDLNINSSRLPSDFTLSTEFQVSAFDIASFTGNIDYHMDQIDIAPIALNDLPEFLDSPDTEIRIADPSIEININNPVGQYGLVGSGKIELTSVFNAGYTTTATSDQFTIPQSGANLNFGTNSGQIPFNGLGDILANSNAGGLPVSIKVNLLDIQFKGHAVDFPIGTIENAVGDYSFSAPLGFADGSKVIYDTEVNDFGEDVIDRVFVNHLKLNALCTTDLPVGVQLSVIPIDKNGNPIAVKENSADFNVVPNSQRQPVSLVIEGANGPIRNLDGIKFRATVYQNNNSTQPLGPELNIKLDDIRISVDGYYETDFE